MKTPCFVALGLLIVSATTQSAHAQSAHAQSAHAQSASGSGAPLRTLIVSGGPSFEANQYAIESNARYVESLTNQSRWRRIHFADGQPNSRTIAVSENTPAFRAGRALAWILDEDLPDDRIVARPSTLKTLDGASTKASVTRVLGEFARPAAGERGLLYFTGHGNAGTTWLRRPDYENTTFALWDNDKISQRELGHSIRAWPASHPLFVVMVQCHSGGFANLIFEEGDPKKPLLNRDIAGFFSSTGARVAAGCTPEVNERDYQDFTTHFFAALSGTSRDGRKISGADYDKNGRVSGSEAFAWASINDLSVDVPVCTSDAYLRSIFAYGNDNWKNTPYSQALSNVQPWQTALLDALSARLNLRGEARIAAAVNRLRVLQSRNRDEETAVSGVDENVLGEKLQTLKSQLMRRYPALRQAPDSSAYRAARGQAQKWLQARPADVAYLDEALSKYRRANESSEVREAMTERFVRGVYTLVLQNRLRAEGTPAQQAAFAKLRAAEGRNPLR